MTRVRDVMLAALISLAFAACSGHGDVAAPSAASITPQLTVTSPLATRELDGPTFLVEGTYQPNTLAGDIWVLVRPQMDFDNVYPQSGNAPAGTPATKKQDGTWSVTASFGGPPQFFDILAVNSMDASALMRLSDAVRQSGKLPASSIAAPAFAQSPSIRVTRKPLATFIDPAGDVTIPASTTTMTIRGKYPLGVNDDVWLLIWPEQAPGIGYPQSPNAAAGLPSVKDSSRLEWSVPVALGGPPQLYEFRVYTANPQASGVLSASLRASVSSGNFGIAEGVLPKDGLFEQMRIRVRRQ